MHISRRTASARRAASRSRARSGALFAALLASLLACQSRAADVVAELTEPPSPPTVGFGWDIALANGTLACSRYDSFFQVGAASVYQKSAEGWEYQQALVPPPGVQLQGYGIAIDIDDSGERIVVGASRAGPTFAGLAFVFVRVGDVWEFEATLTPSDGVFGDRFGEAVTIRGNTVAIGAPRGRGATHGAVYIYTRSGGTWSQSQFVVASDAGSDDLFGSGVALGDGVLMIGAPEWDSAANNNVGVVYVFNKVGNAFVESQKLAPPGLMFQHRIGYSIDIEGERAALGWQFGGNGGRVATYLRSGGVWSLESIIEPPNISNSARFGYSVALDGERLAVGAMTDRPLPSAPDSGAAFLFERAPNGWLQLSKFVACAGQSLDELGRSVALRGIDLAAGAPARGPIGGPDANQGVVFVLDTSLPSPGDCDGDGVNDRCEVELGLAEDCNGNLVPDECDIASGAITDCDRDGVPDDCQRSPDLDGDGDVDGRDLGLLLASWGRCGCCDADLDADGEVGDEDLAILLSQWSSSVTPRFPLAGGDTLR